MAVLRPVAGLSAVSLALGHLLLTSHAGAYCRTTTCDTVSATDPMATHCAKDHDGCTTEGIPVAWKSGCLTYGIQANGSKLRKITPEQVGGLVQKAFDTWTHAACKQGGTPPITAQSVGLVECNEPEYNCDVGSYNTNTIMFRDDEWPTAYSSSALAITTVTVNLKTGEILDADTEINSKDFSFTTSNVNVNNDLLSVLTHEVGHFLGLAHSPVTDATMYYGYNSSSTSIRSLDPDDVAGICDIYPPAASDPKCESEFQTALECLPDTACLGGSETCAKGLRCGETEPASKTCSFEPPQETSSNAAALFTAIGGSLVVVARRSKRRPSPGVGR